MEFTTTSLHPGISMKDHVTPFKIAVVVMMEEYLKNERKPKFEREIYSEKEETTTLLLILKLVQVSLQNYRVYVQVFAKLYSHFRTGKPLQQPWILLVTLWIWYIFRAVTWNWVNWCIQYRKLISQYYWNPPLRGKCYKYNWGFCVICG